MLYRRINDAVGDWHIPDAPGYSVRETGERMNGGAVMVERSLDIEAILY